jgi:DEAD/DEAH box helicase domain-containing protein
MDVGDLNWVITEPVSINRVEQRSGRAGRKGQESGLIIHLVRNDPISNYYAHNPNEYFSNLEMSILHTDNKYVVENQLLLATMDQPVNVNEHFFSKFQDEFHQILEENSPRLTKNGEEIEVTEEGVIFCKKYCKTIRGSNESVLIKENMIIGERSLPMAISELFPGATYFARGQRYKVKALRLGKYPRKGVAFVRRAKHYEFEKTSPFVILKPKVIKFIERKKVLGVEVGYGKVQVLLFLRSYGIYSNAGRLLRTAEIDKPIAYSFNTTGVIFKVPDLLSKNSTIHGLTHVIQQTSKSIGAKDTKVVGLSPTGYILIYDDSSGGNGLSLMIYENFDTILHRTYDILNSCKCRLPFGCPKCMTMFFCPHNNKELEKGETKRILEILRNSTNDIKLGTTYNKFNRTYL